MQKPKILTLDLEITPQEGYFWGKKWDTSIVKVTKHSLILSYSAKWLNGKFITKGWPDYKGYKPGKLDDEAIVRDLWELLNQTDILVVQNGRAFDTKMATARFLYYRLPPPSPYKIVDTLTENRKILKQPSFNLNDVCDYYGIGRKQEHEGFPLWEKCMIGDTKAWGRMLKYNKQDVNLTEQLYLLIRPYIKNHPNLGMYSNHPCCPKCLGTDLEWRGYTMNSTTKYARFQCKSCKGWGRKALNEQATKVLIPL